jgi:queuine tRNA-ribosyltransferase
MNGFRFTITHTLHGTLARAGIINTPHGRLETPAFIAGGTKATVKALTPEQVIEAGGQAVLANTYHLMLQPGAEIVQAAGGLYALVRANIHRQRRLPGIFARYGIQEGN